MAYENLLDSFKSLLTGPLAHQAPQLLGQPNVGAEVDHLLPNLLGAIVHRGSNSNEGSAALRDLLNSSSVDTGLLSNDAGEVLAGGPQTEALLQSGQAQLGQLFGAKQSNLENAVANVAGVNAEQGATLSAAATPFALALMKNTLSPAGDPISAAKLARFLDAQKKYCGGLSEAFFAALGLGSLGAWLAIKPIAVPAKPVPPIASAVAAAPARKGHRWLLWLILAALIVALLAWCTQHRSGTPDQAAGASAASDASAVAASDASAATATVAASSADQGASAAADTSAINAASTSDTEAASSAASTDTAAASAATGATTSTGAAEATHGATGAAVGQSSESGLPLKVYFATGKATLSSHFRKQTRAVIAYAKAHPDAKFAVTGYTDARGSVHNNLELAKRRAEAVAHVLAAEGINASRLSLQRPSTTSEETGGSGQESRRVEVSVQQ